MKFTDDELLLLLDCRDGCACPHTTKSVAHRLGVDRSTALVRLYKLEDLGWVARVKRAASTEWRALGFAE